MDKTKLKFLEDTGVVGLVKLAYKERARQSGYMDKEKDFAIERREDNAGEKLTLYCCYNNYENLDKEIKADGYIQIKITGFDELLQVKLGFEYEVQADYMTI